MEASPQVQAQQEGQCWHVCVGGHWQMNSPWPSEAHQAIEGVGSGDIRSLHLEARRLEDWDSSLLVFLVQLVKTARARDLTVDTDLPEGLQRLLQLAFAVPEQKGAARSSEKHSLFYNVGDACLNMLPAINDFLEFCSETLLSTGRFFRGKAKMRPQDFMASIQECGVHALPIISLTSLLFGLILAFVGAVQLTQFGAQIYVAGLVGIGMLRVMGAIMVGVVMAGRVGASFAALIGTMQVNEEVDALETLGVSPIDFLVLPRLLALTLMVPLLTLYADLMGVLGGYLVGVFMLGLNPLEYIVATTDMVPFKHIIIGLVYATVFGIIIAIAGCYQGIRCGRSAQAVGQATTTAVVHSIVGIIVATAIITIICNALEV